MDNFDITLTEFDFDSDVVIVKSAKLFKSSSEFSGCGNFLGVNRYDIFKILEVEK